MSPLVGIFVITLLSSILYNKFDVNSRTATTRKNPYYSFEKSNAKSEGKENSKDEESSDENEDGLAFENISEMDVCIFTIVAGNQMFCKEKTDENLNRLTLLMMSCHTASEDNKFPKCTTEKTFSECISRLNTADLEIFKNVKKRALTVCQEVSQQLFMINSQRRTQALLETAQLHFSVMTSFKDNQKLLENITSRTLTRLRAQRVAFMKDMRLFKKYFTKNESLLIEAARAHLTLLSRHKEIIGGLEKDVNVLTEGFLQSLEAMQDNFTAFSVKIFEKHGEIMANLNRVENTADKILKQLEIIEEYDYTVTLKNAFNWIMANLWRSRQTICVVLSSIIYSSVVRSQLFTWIKFVLMASVIGGVFLQYEYVGLLIAAWFMSILAEIFIRCFSTLTNGRIQTAEMNSSVGNGSVFGIEENKTGETSGENSTLNDSLGPDSSNRDNVKSTMSSTIVVGESTITRDSGGENGEGRDNIGPHTTSVIGATENTSSQSVNITSVTATENENNQTPGTRGDSMVLQGTMVGFETPSPVTGRGGPSMGIEVQNSRDNMVQDSTTRNSQGQNRIRERQHGYSSTIEDLIVQRSIQTRSMGPNLNEHQDLPRGKSVQTTTICDSEVQTGPGNDMAVQTSTQCDREVQTGASENVSVQTSTRNESSAQTNTYKVVGVQVGTRDDSNMGILGVQTDTVNDIAVQTSIRDDSAAQADGSIDIATKGNSYVQNDTDEVTEGQTSTTGDSSVHARTNSAFMVVQTSIRGDSSLQTGTSNDITGQPGHNKDLVGQRGKTYDFGVPHEPLGIQDEMTSSIPRQSGIIVNIGDNFGNSRGQTPSPRRQSRTSSPFEVVAGDIRRSSGTYGDIRDSTVMSGLRQVSQDISGEAGTTGELSSIQVGVQINRAGSSGQRRECGLMTLQGTPCRRRVSAGRCFLHRDSRQ